MTPLLVHQNRNNRGNARIHKVVRISGNKGSKDVKALFDFRASESFIRADIAKELSSLCPT